MDLHCSLGLRGGYGMCEDGDVQDSASLGSTIIEAYVAPDALFAAFAGLHRHDPWPGGAPPTESGP